MKKDYDFFLKKVDYLQSKIVTAKSFLRKLCRIRELHKVIYEFHKEMAENSIKSSTSQRSHEADVVVYSNLVLEDTDKILDYLEMVRM